MPLETISGAGHTSRREAGTTGANLGIALTLVKISTVFFAVAAVERGEDNAEKIKGRPVAADEKPGELDILFSQLSGNAKAESALGRQILYIRFLFAFKQYLFPARYCQVIR
jgi:hypothetical protein